jgi:uncharacterized protein (TIGR03067 family)
MRRPLLLAAVLSLAFAPAPRPKLNASKDDLAKMQGQWVRTSLTINGKKHDEPQGCAVTIKGDVLAFPSPDDAWKLTIDATKKPKWIDSRRVKPAGSIGPFWGVYRLEGDTLTICWREDANVTDRPADFDPSQRHVWLQVFQRKKR